LKKIIAILLLFSLLAPVAGLYLWLRYEKKQVKEEVKQAILSGLEKDQLVCLTFPVEEVERMIEWENEYEFEYRGEMYDVVETEYSGIMISYWCWHDSKETRLKDQIEDLLAGGSDDAPVTKDKQIKLLQFYKTLYPTITGQIEPIHPIISNIEGDQIRKHWKSPFISPPVPPPEIV
jgi:hypothetical protein